MSCNGKNDSWLGRDNLGISPILANPYLLIIILILAIILIFGSLILVALTTKTILTVALVGIGLYLFIRPHLLAGLGSMGRWAIPIGLIGLGIVFYLGWLKL
jgi:hypothetical protein